jgi:hypothetical protein
MEPFSDRSQQHDPSPYTSPSEELGRLVRAGSVKLQLDEVGKLSLFREGVECSARPTSIAQAFDIVEEWRSKVDKIRSQAPALLDNLISNYQKELSALKLKLPLLKKTQEILPDEVNEWSTTVHVATMQWVRKCIRRSEEANPLIRPSLPPEFVSDIVQGYEILQPYYQRIESLAEEASDYEIEEDQFLAGEGEEWKPDDSERLLDKVANAFTQPASVELLVQTVSTLVPLQDDFSRQKLVQLFDRWNTTSTPLERKAMISVLGARIVRGDPHEDFVQRLLPLLSSSVDIGKAAADALSPLLSDPQVAESLTVWGLANWTVAGDLIDLIAYQAAPSGSKARFQLMVKYIGGSDSEELEGYGLKPDDSQVLPERFRAIESKLQAMGSGRSSGVEVGNFVVRPIANVFEYEALHSFLRMRTSSPSAEFTRWADTDYVVFDQTDHRIIGGVALAREGVVFDVSSIRAEDFRGRRGILEALLVGAYKSVIQHSPDATLIWRTCLSVCIASGAGPELGGVPLEKLAR